jgi:hypothetical protein
MRGCSSCCGLGLGRSLGASPFCFDDLTDALVPEAGQGGHVLARHPAGRCLGDHLVAGQPQPLRLLDGLAVCLLGRLEAASFGRFPEVGLADYAAGFCDAHLLFLGHTGTIARPPAHFIR